MPGFYESNIPISRAVVKTFQKDAAIYFAKGSNGAVYISNGHFILRTNQADLDKLITQINNRRKTWPINAVENKRILEYVTSGKGNFELSQKPHELEVHKKHTSYFYADNKQYFQYDKKYVDILSNVLNRLFVDDSTGYDINSHSMIVKNRSNEVLGVVLPIEVTRTIYDKLANVLPLEIGWKSPIERIKENPKNDPYIGKEFFDGVNTHIVSAIRKHNGVDMYIVPNIENGELTRRADVIKVDEIEKYIALWEANKQKAVKDVANKKSITYIEVLKRTFEGKTDPTKNDDVLTSKYYTSKKYLLRYKFLGSDNAINETYETKSLAEFAKEQTLKFNIDGRMNIAEQTDKKQGIKKQMEDGAKQAAKHNAALPTPAKIKKAQNAEI